jgi:hypothetical protein
VNDDGRRVIIHAKSNYGPKADTIGFSFGDEGFTWDGIQATIRESDVRARAASTPKRTKPAGYVRGQCREWLEEFLADGPKSKKEIEAACEFSPETLGRAADQLGVAKIREKGFGAVSLWYPAGWEFPKDSTADVMDSNSQIHREKPSSHHQVTSLDSAGADLMVETSADDVVHFGARSGILSFGQELNGESDSAAEESSA